MRIYNVAGYTLLILHALVAAYLAPPHLGPGRGFVVGVLYLLFIWLVAGIYLPEILHMGIAHRALEFKGWAAPKWEPGRWTALFFHDEAVALAAGHRPCALCRRAAYQRYRERPAEQVPAPGAARA